MWVVNLELKELKSLRLVEPGATNLPSVVYGSFDMYFRINMNLNQWFVICSKDIFNNFILFYFKLLYPSRIFILEFFYFSPVNSCMTPLQRLEIFSISAKLNFKKLPWWPNKVGVICKMWELILHVSTCSYYLSLLLLPRFPLLAIIFLAAMRLLLCMTSLIY